jgi:molybdopterin/thiamine biosynthesis adenylyltransferase
MDVLQADRLAEDRFERSKRIKWLDMDAIQSSKVLIVGAGAIGNEVAKNLVLSGFRNITILDMDYIERSNLNRCIFFSELDANQKRLKAEVVAERLRDMADDLNVTHHSQRFRRQGPGGHGSG